MILPILVKSQDCKTHYEVEAGPGIDVCEGGSVQLHGSFGGDATEAVWQGGKGTFVPGRHFAETEYTPAVEETGSEVVLTLVASNPKLRCPPAKSEIKLIVNSQPIANAGSNQQKCAGDLLQLNGKISGKAKRITWITNGNGTFDNAHKLEAVYTPSATDLRKGGCSIMLLAEPFGFCNEDSSTMTLTIATAPQFRTDSVVNSTGKQPVKLSIKEVENGKNIIWSTNGNGVFDNATQAETLYRPSSDDINKGRIQLQVKMISEAYKCETIKKIILNCKP